MEFRKEAVDDTYWLEDLALLLQRCLALMEEMQSPANVDSPTFVAFIVWELSTKLNE